MHSSTAAYYERFSTVEAAAVSPLYAEWTAGIARDDEVLQLIDTLPRAKRQANLVLGVSRLLGVPETGYDEFRSWLLAHWAVLEREALTRSAQTNEPGRCATLLPFLSEIDGPIALLEVGASAGLCLYPDRYSYRFETDDGVHALDPVDGASSLILRCVYDSIAPPARMPEVVWRGGIDLDPLDVTDSADLAWLDALIWPGQHDRRERLQCAASIAATQPAKLVQGSMLDALPVLADEVPRDAHLVVFHSAVLPYLDEATRDAFIAKVQTLPNSTWISNEGGHFLPGEGWQPPSATDGRFVVAVNAVPRALAGPHGQSLSGIA